jgi:hypothetical protein
VNSRLRRLYEASEEDMRFAIGTMQQGTDLPMPIICIVYRDWSREQLKIVRESFHAGITLTHQEHGPGVHQIRLATLETITIEQAEGGHTSVLRAPAWDADLVGIDGAALRAFDDDPSPFHVAWLVAEHPVTALVAAMAVEVAQHFKLEIRLTLIQRGQPEGPGHLVKVEIVLCRQSKRMC